MKKIVLANYITCEFVYISTTNCKLLLNKEVKYHELVVHMNQKEKISHIWKGEKNSY